MKPALDFDKPFDKSLRRVIRAELSTAVKTARDESHPLATRIHEARKHTKNLRALLRLARRALPNYKAANAALREASQDLASLRDAAVRQATLEWLRKEGFLPSEMLSYALLRDRLATETPAPYPQEQRLALFATRMEALIRKRSCWKIDTHNWQTLSEGAAKTFRNARHALDRAHATLAPADFHELRKQVKHHARQLKLLQPLPGTPPARRRKTAGDLADILGRHHDLEALLTHAGSDASLRDDVLLGLADAIRAAQDRLGEEALQIADELFSEKPKKLERQMQRSVRRRSEAPAHGSAT